jgi:hypothetical protein
MRRESRNRILKAFDGFSRQLGLPLPEALKRLRKAVKKDVLFWKNHGDVRSLEAFLIKAPSPTEKELAGFEAFFELAPWLMRAVSETILPSDPGGRSWDLTEDQCNTAKAEIKGRLSRMPLDQAIEEAAHKFQVVPETMRKIYDGATDTKEFQKGEIKRRVRKMIAAKSRPEQQG